MFVLAWAKTGHNALVINRTSTIVWEVTATFVVHIVECSPRAMKVRYAEKQAQLVEGAKVWKTRVSRRECSYQ